MNTVAAMHVRCPGCQAVTWFEIRRESRMTDDPNATLLRNNLGRITQLKWPDREHVYCHKCATLIEVAISSAAVDDFRPTAAVVSAESRRTQIERAVRRDPSILGGPYGNAGRTS